MLQQASPRDREMLAKQRTTQKERAERCCLLFRAADTHAAPTTTTNQRSCAVQRARTELQRQSLFLQAAGGRNAGKLSTKLIDMRL